MAALCVRNRSCAADLADGNQYAPAPGDEERRSRRRKRLLLAEPFTFQPREETPPPAKIILPPKPCLLCLKMEPEEALRQCQNCTISGHQSCIGAVDDGVEPDDWLCDMCSFVNERKHAPPVRGLVLTPTDRARTPAAVSAQPSRSRPSKRPSPTRWTCSSPRAPQGALVDAATSLTMQMDPPHLRCLAARDGVRRSDPTAARRRRRDCAVRAEQHGPSAPSVARLTGRNASSAARASARASAATTARGHSTSAAPGPRTCASASRSCRWPRSRRSGCIRSA